MNDATKHAHSTCTLYSHTPGPWIVAQYSSGAEIYAQAHGPIIATVNCSRDDNANAALIALAPTLLTQRDALSKQVADLRAVVQELGSYAELKLSGHRQDYDEEHCMVQTAIRMVELARAALERSV